ncbi:hypothetical protein YK48G_08300 [Lentilactobacillus fungorum]|uniref:Uncharacterized protein n=1 Tax=Lentilactobacillus fungorum TaxID=2201250 RepID=A0ABQ3VWY0_9LACO|nr:hypothetical protein [Lentilactobacillus fungorum]GHP13405.1 hypothetical protein YK48G_08300 [Lentilactobacillus fungorum]
MVNIIFNVLTVSTGFVSVIISVFSLRISCKNSKQNRKESKLAIEKVNKALAESEIRKLNELKQILEAMYNLFIRINLDNADQFRKEMEKLRSQYNSLISLLNISRNTLSGITALVRDIDDYLLRQDIYLNLKQSNNPEKEAKAAKQVDPVRTRVEDGYLHIYKQVDLLIDNAKKQLPKI